MAAWKKQKRIDLNPSSADRWTTCTASPKFIYDNWEKLPVEDRTFADPGTTAHEVAAALLQGRAVSRKDCPAPVDAEMRWNGWQYMEFVESLIEPDGQVMVEQKLPLFYAENRNAIVDAVVINPTNLHIVDYKYGEGIIVDPTNNLQATIYAYCVIWDTDHMADILQGNKDFPISITIYQPRSRNAEDAPFHTWETTWGDISHKAAMIHGIASTVQLGTDGVFVPSEKACQWCPAKGFCNHRHQDGVDKLELMMPQGEALQTVLNEKQLAALLAHKDTLIKWLNDASDYALQFMKGGGKIPGFKLVTSRGGNRFWTDPEKAAKYLLADTILRKEEIFSEPKLVGPAAVEKLLGKGKIPGRAWSLIAKLPGSPIIASEDDPRENALIDGASEFENLDAVKLNLDQF